MGREDCSATGIPEPRKCGSVGSAMRKRDKRVDNQVADTDICCTFGASKV